MRQLLLVFSCLLFTSTGFSQYSEEEWDDILNNYNPVRKHLTASTLLAEGYYAAAERIVDKQLESDPENANLNYRKGFVLCESRHLYADAITYFEKAKPGVVKNYDALNFKEKGAPYDLYYFLAKSYHRIGKTNDALANYTAFLNMAQEKTKLHLEAETAIAQLENARLIETKKQNVEIVNIGSAVNTKSPEYSPVISLDGNSLYFTSRRKWDGSTNIVDLDPQTDFYPEDIYVSYKDENGAWMAPERMNFCYEDQNEASVSVSPSERKIYIYQDIIGNGDLFFSEFKNNRFGKINHLENTKINDKEAWETHCYVTPDGRNMYFSSNRNGGYGGRDIYRVVLLPDRTWSEPMNLGPTINTPHDEESPFMSIDNKTLYFASNGPGSVGGFDIFVSVIYGNNEWSDPVNLGFPVNSYDDDLFYTETIDGRKGYITSIRPDTHGEKDIYEVNNDYTNQKYGHYIKGNITTTTREPIPEDLVIALDCIDCDDLYDVSNYPNIRTGFYANSLQPCQEYDVVLSKKDGSEEFHRVKIKTDCELNYEEIVQDFVIDLKKWIVVDGKDTVPAIVNVDTIVPRDTIIPADTTTTVVPVNFDNISFKYNFGYNKNQLDLKTKELKNFVTMIDKQLADGRKTITIHINSSASYVPTGRFKDNNELARLRAENMMKILKDHFKKSPQVKIVIDGATVSGPAYSGDNKDEQKYIPYQFVELRTE